MCADSTDIFSEMDGIVDYLFHGMTRDFFPAPSSFKDFMPAGSVQL